MERVRSIMTWAKSAYIVYGFVFIGILGGLIQVLALADQINYGTVRLLEINPAGPELSGKFLFPKNLVVLCTLFLAMVLIFAATAILRAFVDTDDTSKQDVIGLRRDVDDIIRFAENITGNLFATDIEVGRLDIISARVRYNVSADGDVLSDGIFRVKTLDQPAHFWHYWIDADPESGPVKFLKDLNFEAIDVNSGVQLDWLPIKHEVRSKIFAIFFREIPPHTEKTIRVSFRWPGYMRKLIEIGVARYDWRYSGRSSDMHLSVRHEWNFSNEIGNVTCRMTGPLSQTASLLRERVGGNTVWIYDDNQAIDRGKCSMEFTRSEL